MHVQRIRDTFQDEWLKYSKTEQLLAKSMPLPRSWVPYLDDAAADVLYLNTRTNELHRLNPNVAAITLHLQDQWLKGQGYLQSALEQVSQQQHLVQAASASLLDKLHHEMQHAMLQNID